MTRGCFELALRIRVCVCACVHLCLCLLGVWGLTRFRTHKLLSFPSPLTLSPPRPLSLFLSPSFPLPIRVCPTRCISTPWLHVSPMCHPTCTPMSRPMCHPILTRSLSLQNASTALSPSKGRKCTCEGGVDEKERRTCFVERRRTCFIESKHRKRGGRYARPSNIGAGNDDGRSSYEPGRLKNVMCVRLVVE